MKKLNNKKGFTIVELVIVIAVIGILAAVLIPTFSGVVESANNAAAASDARNALEQAVIAAGGEVPQNDSLTYGDYTFTYSNGNLSAVTSSSSGYTYTVENNAIVSATKTANGGN